MSEMKFQREDNGFVRVQTTGFNDVVFTIDEWTKVVATVSAEGDTIYSRGRARDLHTLIVDEPKAREDEAEAEAITFLNNDKDEEEEEEEE